VKTAAAWLLWTAAAADDDVTLVSADGRRVPLASLHKSPATALVFLSAQCPMSNQYIGRLNRLAREFAGRAQVIGVNANANETLDQMRRHAAEYRLEFPVYKDPDNGAADRFEAMVTPQAVVVGRQEKVLYRGRIDDHANPARVKRSDLRLALAAALRGRPTPSAEARGLGCSIKRAEHGPVQPQ